MNKNLGVSQWPMKKVFLYPKRIVIFSDRERITTFIKNNGDRHHPNPLSGYLTALMAYCALTGESAVGQPYDFVEKVMPTKLFVAKHYKECGDTNYPQILASKQEMRRLQKMVDKVLKKTKKQQKQ